LLLAGIALLALGCDSEVVQSQPAGAGGTGTTAAQGGGDHQAGQGGGAQGGGAQGGGGQGGEDCQGLPIGPPPAPSEEAFVTETDDFGSTLYRVVLFSGATPVPRDGGNAGIRALAITSDGAWLAVATWDSPKWELPAGIHLYPVAGGTPLRTLALGRVGDMAFSPDGRFLAYRSSDDDLFVVSTCGGAAETVAPSVTSYAWAPEVDSGAAHLVYRTEAGHLFVADAASATLTSIDLTPTATATQQVMVDVPVFDATSRVYFRGDLDVDDEVRLYRVALDGANREQVPGTDGFTHASGNADIGAFDISADGMQLAFAVDAPTENLFQVYTLDLSGDTAMPLTDVASGATPNTPRGPDGHEPAYFWSPHRTIMWSPDATHLAIVADWPLGPEDDDDEFRPFVVPTTGGAPVRLFTGTGFRTVDVAFSSSSTRVYVIGGDLPPEPNLYSTGDFTTADQDLGDHTNVSSNGSTVGNLLPLP
jgi:hypothetical protein